MDIIIHFIYHITLSCLEVEISFYIIFVGYTFNGTLFFDTLSVTFHCSAIIQVFLNIDFC